MAWADFKQGTAAAFTRAVESGTKAIHAADPAASSAIEGGKIPGWDGYHYSRFAGSVEAMEIYDSGDNIEIVRSFNLGPIMLLTSADAGHSKSPALLSSELMLGGFLPSAPAAIDVVHLDAIGPAEHTVARYSESSLKIR